MRAVLIYLYSAFMILIAAPVFLLLSLFIRGFRKQIFNRQSTKHLDAPTANTVFIYCSSAGELEQGIAIGHELENQSNLKPIYVINSISGSEFVKKRGYDINYFSTPLDNIFAWQWIYRKFKPRATIVVRHDFWPAFLYVAKRCSKLIFANISVTEGQDLTFYKEDALKQADCVFTVDENTTRSLKNSGIPSLVTGDSKYDRAQSLATRNGLKGDLRFSNEEKYIVFGSCWQKDIEVTIHSFEKILKQGFKIILAPHEVSREMIEFIEGKCSGKNYIKFSETDEKTSKPWEILIVDTIGHLQDIYAHSFAALVGGAFHNKVHNVLEPAAFEKYVCYGPKYHNSHEAVGLVQSGLATVIESQADFEKWIDDLTDNNLNRANLSGKLGASSKIASQVIGSTGG